MKYKIFFRYINWGTDSWPWFYTDTKTAADRFLYEAITKYPDVTYRVEVVK